MNDTVNVPVEAIDEFRRWYELDRGRAILKGKARKIVARILSAAAAKVEQEPCPERGMGVCDCSQYHPAPSSELLEAKAMVLDHLMSAEIDGRTAKSRLIEYRTGVLAIAKHKGPQS